MAGLVKNQIGQVKHRIHHAGAHRRARELPGPHDQPSEDNPATEPGGCRKRILPRHDGDALRYGQRRLRDCFSHPVLELRENEPAPWTLEGFGGRR